MFVFKPCCENLLLLPPKIFTTTTNSKTLHLHLHHHDVKQLHFSSLKAHFKSTLSSSPPPPPPQPQSDSSPPAAADSSSSTLTTTTTTVDFLMDSGGLSYQEALRVIRRVPTLLQDGGRNPRLVIAYFESIGFTKTHISKTISKHSRSLVADVEKTIKPKIQFFQDFGFSESDIADLIALQPTILCRSLKNQIKPTVELIKSFVKTDEDLIKIIKRNAYLLLVTNIKRNYIEPNIDILRHHGVPDSEILHLILTRLLTLLLTPKVFKSIVKRIVSLGFKPETRKFAFAVSVMCSMKKAIWDSKIDLLKGCLGWSDQQILDAFIRHPIFLAVSGEKMKVGIEFYKESFLNWDTASVLSQHPIILNYSLKVRVIPRFAVLKCLMFKDIIKEDKEFIAMLNLNETQFLSRYVFKYQEQLPYLYEVYNKKECILGECEEDNGDREITNQHDHDDIDINLG